MYKTVHSMSFNGELTTHTASQDALSRILLGIVRKISSAPKALTGKP